ncbi:unnamed protein product [Microthlaspi erraticum]|uniref:Uncharacterized protein n=1 Tax=Microthlaspi erraticum TaxID=1685480 RepID=A0A6D2KF66_9BRAS|nr:unnamed protein product [Microthlaspi erraticum]
MKWYIQGLVFGYLSAPQRTGRLGRGLEMGDGHQDAPCNWVASCSLDRACGSSSSSSSSSNVCGFLGLGGAVLARSCCRGPVVWEKSWYCVDRTRIQDSQTGAPPGQLDPQLDRVEFPLFGLDRVRWSSWSVWPWKSSSFSACCLSFPWLERRGSVRLLGRASLSGEE